MRRTGMEKHFLTLQTSVAAEELRDRLRPWEPSSIRVDFSNGVSTKDFKRRTPFDEHPLIKFSLVEAAIPFAEISAGRMLDLGATPATTVEKRIEALHQLGFSELEGIDLSPSLAAAYAGPGKILVGDCRQIPFENASKDILIVQGDLHHLPVLPDDLDRVLNEGARVLSKDGLLVVVEPWATLFLSVSHAVCRSRIIRTLLPKVDALATMIHYERKTYEQWLSHPDLSDCSKSFESSAVISGGENIFRRTWTC